MGFCTFAMMKKLLIAAIAAGAALNAAGYELTSPDGDIVVTVNADSILQYSASFKGREVIAPSRMALTLGTGKSVGRKPKVKSAKRLSVNGKIASPFYRADSLTEKYNALQLKLADGWAVELRAYNDGIAYRFADGNKRRKPYVIESELAEFCFPTDGTATVPYVLPRNEPGFEPQFFNSFENTYAMSPISKLDKSRLTFLPVVVEPTEGIKVAVSEVNLRDYPGMYLNSGNRPNTLSAVMAPLPDSLAQGGHNQLQLVPVSRKNHIAEVSGPRTFPWRMAVITDNDADLAASNMSYLLADPSRIEDTSWIRPGKVAWEWWNDWNVIGVDFPTGINNATYKAYIDFAAKHGIEYVILDEGWAVNLKADLMDVVPEIDIKELVDYGAGRGVGIILWAGYYAFDRDMENVCKHYADMGVKGFKVDFMDRDDQLMTDFNYRAAETAARYHLLLDLHGTHKPAGMNRTWPNVLNFEGVHGMEQMKWTDRRTDQVTYDVMLPFLRQISGPMDYTQGAMLNAQPGSYVSNYSEPMSQGTRCRQLALYVVFDSPLNMLCDSPSNYEREPECTDFISAIPTTWDETRVISGKMGEQIVTARRKGSIWYVGGLTNRDARTIELPLAFLPEGTSYTATIFTDGVNAARAGRDYKRAEQKVTATDNLTIAMAPGGGFAIKFEAE